MAMAPRTRPAKPTAAPAAGPYPKSYLAPAAEDEDAEEEEPDAAAVPVAALAAEEAALEAAERVEDAAEEAPETAEEAAEETDEAAEERSVLDAVAVSVSVEDDDWARTVSESGGTRQFTTFFTPAEEVTDLGCWLERKPRRGRRRTWWRTAWCSLSVFEWERVWEMVVVGGQGVN